MMMIESTKEVQIDLFVTEEVTMSDKYLDFTDMFSKKSTAVPYNHNVINKHTINLEEKNQWIYMIVDSLEPMGLEIFKT